jgi:hypothetical protein
LDSACLNVGTTYLHIGDAEAITATWDASKGEKLMGQSFKEHTQARHIHISALDFRFLICNFINGEFLIHYSIFANSEIYSLKRSLSEELNDHNLEEKLTKSVQACCVIVKHDFLFTGAGKSAHWLTSTKSFAASKLK